MKKAMKVSASYGLVLQIALVMAVNYQLFVFPNSFAPAGLNGVFTMLQHLVGFKLSYASILLNVPLAVATWILCSRSMALRTLTYVVAFSGFLMVLEHIDLSAFVYSTAISALLGPVVAGLIAGFCGYVMHRLSGCLGGTDFIAALIHRYKPNFNFFYLIFVLNVAVAGISYFVYDYKIEPVPLCIIYSYFSSNIRVNMNRKYQSAVRCEIVTEYPQELGQAIIRNLHHTATMFVGRGMYSGKDKQMLVCVINPSQVTELTKLVAQYPGSFVTVSNVNRVVGNFKRLDSRGKPEVVLFDGGSQ
jgi:uncharacterized membrane-anchored protein YitT (DUF2179 family)